MINIAQRLEARDYALRRSDYARRATRWQRAAAASDGWRSLTTSPPQTQAECEYYAVEFAARAELAGLYLARAKAAQ